VVTTAAEISQKLDLSIEYQHKIYLCEWNDQNNAIFSFFS